jgi:two-component sensor histidine kinase
MQGRAMRDEPTRIALQECRSRVETMAEIHAMLYQSKDYARIPFSRYARELATRVMRASEIAPSAIRLDFELEEIFLTVDKAIPCGLIVNELVSNALKHAFPNAREGTIRLELKGAPEHRIVLGVADDGIGMPADFEPEKAKSLGVQLVVSLAQQLDGVIDIAREHGTAVRISFLPEASP